MSKLAGAQHGGAGVHAALTSGRMFVASRTGQLAFSGLMLVNDRRRFTDTRMQAAIWVALVAESGWLARRILKAGRYEDRVGMWTDTLTSAAALALSQRGLSEGAAPWVKNVAIGATIGASSSRRNGDAVAAVGALCLSALVTGRRPGGRDAHVAGLALAINDAISWAGQSAAARVYLLAHRAYAEERDEADELAVERSAAAAAQAERGRQHEVLHQVTIRALRRIAASADAAAALSVARSEATRLRYALRTEGRLPEGLDEALAEVAEQAAAAGVQVELVTAELDADPGPVAVAALRSAIAAALSVAGELGGARRAVVRAHGDAEQVRVSVRDRGRGFDPAASSDYATRLADIAAEFASCGGALAIRSEPGEGVRLDLEIRSGTDVAAGSTGEPHRADDAAQGVPGVGVGLSSAGDGHRTLVDQHVHRGVGGRAGAEHDVRVLGDGDDHAGVPGDALEPGAQERAVRRDAHGPRSGHPRSLARRLTSRVGVSTQFAQLTEAETRRADRTLLAALVTWRAGGLLTGAAALIAGRHQYRRRSIAVTQLVVGVAESAWFAQRAASRARWSDPTGSAVDALTAAGLLALSQRNLAPADRVTWLNWVPWSLAENVLCGQAMADNPPTLRAAGAALVAGAQVWQGPRWGDRIVNATAHGAFFFVATGFARQIRSGAVLLARSRAAAVREGEALAEARERARSLRLLHDSAVQTLEAIANGRYPDFELIRERAVQEADQLERDLVRSVAAPAALAELVRAIVAEHADAGLTVRVDAEPELRVPGGVAEAMAGVCREALTNVAKHAGVSHARVQLQTQGTVTVMEVRDDGVGFDPAGDTRGFGMRHSIRERMADVGGRAEVHTAPGQGTRVIARWPA